MIESEQVQQGGVQVVDADPVLDRLVTELVAFAVVNAALDSTTRQPDGVGVRVVVAPLAALRVRRPAKLAAPDHQGGIEQTARLQVGEQRPDRLIATGRTVAKRMNGRAEMLMGRLKRSRKRANALSALVGLATVFQFDIKSTAAASNLSGEELKAMMEKGYPDNPILNNSLTYISKILRSFPMDKRTNLIETLLAYIDRLPKIGIEDLQNYSRVLLYATAEIGRDKRIASELT